MEFRVGCILISRKYALDDMAQSFTDASISLA